MSISKYIPEIFVNYDDRSDIDNQTYQLVVSTKTLYEVENAVVGNRAFISVMTGETNDKISLPLEPNGVEYDVVVLTGGMYADLKNTSDFTINISSTYNNFIDDTSILGYQGDPSIFLLYFDKTTEEFVSAKKCYLIDNTNALMGNGSLNIYPQILNSSAYVILNNANCQAVSIFVGGLVFKEAISESYDYETYKYTLSQDRILLGYDI